MSDGDRDKLDVFHRSVAKRIQGLSEKTPNVMCMAQLGWLSLSATIDIKCLMFLRTLLMGATPSICRSISISRWTEICYGLVNMTSVSPMVQLYSVCAKYGLLNHVNSWLDGGRVISKHSWKEIVYKAVYTREYSLWKCLCVLYPRCDIFSCVINDISLCIWWYFAQENIYVAKKCQTILKLMTKENVLQANACRYDKNSSTLCPL